MRNSAGSWVVKIFLFVLALSFVFWGVGDFARQGDEAPVAKVGDTAISSFEFSEQLRRELFALQNRLGAGFDMEQARQLGVVDALLQRLVGRALLDQAAASLDIRVADSVVREDIVRNPAFQTELGRFDRMRFEQVLAGQGWNEQMYVDIVRRDLVRERLVGTVASGADAAPGLLADAIFGHRQERRAAEVLELPVTAVPAPPQPDEAALRDYHQQNAGRFTAPEYRALTFVDLRQENLLDQVAVPEQELRDEYERRRHTYAVPERRSLEQMLFPDRDAAEAAYARLADGGNFHAVAQAVLNQSPADIGLGTVSREELPAEVGEAAFALNRGAISRPVESPFGWHILRVTEVQPGSIREFDEVRDELRRELAMRQTADLIWDLANELEDELAGGAGLEQAARALDIPVHKHPAVNRRGQDPNGQPIADLPADPNFLAVAFDTPVGVEPQAIESQGGGYFLVQVDDITPPALRPLDTVRDEVAAAWVSDRRQEALSARAEQLAEQIRGGADMAALAAETGGRTFVLQPVTRTGDGAQAPLSPDLLSSLFAARAGEVVTAPAAGEGFAVARLTGIERPDRTTEAKAFEDIERQLALGIGDDLVEQYRAALASEIGVQINQQAVERLF